MFFPKISRTWWTKNPRYTIYFLRELTGVVIALYVMYFLIYELFYEYRTFSQNAVSQIVSWISLAAAVFHTITWFWVTVKISPVQLKKHIQIATFIGLLAVWIAASYFLLQFFYDRPTF